MSKEQDYQQALKLEEQQDFPGALSVYKKLIEGSDDPRYFIAYGVCLQRLSHWKQSIAPLEHGIELKPHYCEGDARLFLATAYLESGQKKKAIEQWKLVSQMEPEYPSYEHVPDEAKRMLAKYA
ncbi:tetratricopeptide repeat protein [Marinobacter arenosus]|uniref:tetratricopeptide repeat protein n=1 Tax=Marinobacter arenosus TaxID=2856822 RepID=UPI001C4DA517|nr:hypothetical protein [Marinobacter arenosus]MBW0149031.1 hypothetical protein [Marinobacter arenosus]